MINHNMLAGFSAVFWPALINHLWQATIVAGLCLLVLPAFRRTGGNARYVLYAMAFVRFVIPQALVFFVADYFGLPLRGLNVGFGTRLQQVSDRLIQVAQPTISYKHSAALDPVTPGHSEIYCVLTILWMTGCILLLSRWFFRQYRFARSLGTIAHPVDSDLMLIIESLKKMLRFRRQARFQVAWQGSEPGVSGVWRPVLVLPEKMVQQLAPAEIEAVLAHELVHIVRRDNLWSNLQMFVCCFFWFHPIVWVLDRCLIAERERSCDERVLAALSNADAYASGLIKIAGISLGLRPAGVSPIAGANLKRRIENMKKTNRKPALTLRILLFSIAVLTVLFYVLAVPIERSAAQADPAGLTIENSENSPVKIVSATVSNISIPQGRTQDVTAFLIKPRIVVKNNSDRTVSVYVLEFRKADSVPVYLTRRDVGLPPKGTDSIETNKSNTFIYSAGSKKATEPVGTWAVRLDVVRFDDGSLLTLHPSPIPPPDSNGPLQALPKLKNVRPKEPPPKQ